MRTGLFLARRLKLIATWDSEGKGVCWFLGDILIVLLEIRELNPGPQSEREKLDQILAHMRMPGKRQPYTVGLLLMMGHMQNDIGIAPLSTTSLGIAAAGVTTARLNKRISVNC
jgi:hypothetical protein